MRTRKAIVLRSGCFRRDVGRLYAIGSARAQQPAPSTTQPRPFLTERRRERARRFLATSARRVTARKTSKKRCLPKCSSN